MLWAAKLEQKALSLVGTKPLNDFSDYHSTSLYISPKSLDFDVCDCQVLGFRFICPLCSCSRLCVHEPEQTGSASGLVSQQVMLPRAWSFDPSVGSPRSIQRFSPDSLKTRISHLMSVLHGKPSQDCPGRSRRAGSRCPCSGRSPGD